MDDLVDWAFDIQTLDALIAFNVAEEPKMLPKVFYGDNWSIATIDFSAIAHS